MRAAAFTSRNTRELLRDPLNLLFGIAFPVSVLLLLTAIQSRVPADVFRIEELAPGIAVFGLSFMSLFAGVLIATDRATSFLVRLFASPLTSADFMLGYATPLIVMAVVQVCLLFGVAVLLGLTVTWRIASAIAVLLPAAVLFISLGLLAGTVLTDKQVGPICGAVLVNLSAWLSGAWFDPHLVGGLFERIASLLPFLHSVEAARAAFAGDTQGVFADLPWVIAYAVVAATAAILVFGKKMNSEAA